MDISVNKYISDTGFCSRREADKYIEQGRVTINDNIASKGNRVKTGDVVEVDGEPLKKKKATIYMALNKPKGITCTTDTKDKSNIIDYLNYSSRIFPIGRLDKLSEGLIFLTNDGDIVNKILRAGNQHEKEYIVTVDKPVNLEFIKAMRNGVKIMGVVTQKCFVQQEGTNRFRIILTQGLNRQIRRMCEALGYNVEALRRTRIMNITLKDLPPGKWRYFTKEEINTISAMVANSSKTGNNAGNTEGMDE
ncbi:23S rRNA pseudouridine(2604) synthase RluF [Chitinophaga niabensis]|uniref:Pseudouridine synthase n=1 Tax=Chitinophaga niabensis TaxID=536979 RepID=A0A1N6DFV9_9BACT|nr:23S rRNA pseudouridine(2604) synthase RluF [Chitinophaga niabensis]SIN69665.1 ribosomal large subunit pseudouridine synthase F [Chitinophaga niabensis]